MNKKQKKNNAYLITDRNHFLSVLENKCELYKHCIDNYSEKVKIEIPIVFSSILLTMNQKNIKLMFDYFVKHEEYEYAERVKKLIKDEKN